MDAVIGLIFFISFWSFIIWRISKEPTLREDEADDD
jgi:hypothetical protein